MSRSAASVQEIQASFEQRFGCVVCFSAHFEMVSGMCQHRVCAECLYDQNDCLRKVFFKCPVCQHHWSFPQTRPEIPEDNKEMMRCLGVRSCPNRNKGCPVELWEWEVESHIRSCVWKPESPTKKIRTRSRTSQKKTPSPPSRRVTRSGKRYRTYCDSVVTDEDGDCS